MFFAEGGINKIGTKRNILLRGLPNGHACKLYFTEPGYLSFYRVSDFRSQKIVYKVNFEPKTL